MNSQAEPDMALIRHILESSKTIAVVGASSHPDKDAHTVPAYLQSQGCRPISVNPSVEETWGEKAYGSLSAIPEPVDVVQIFRLGETVEPIVEEAIAIGAKTIWMQVGIVNEAAAARARQVGLAVVMNACMRVTHRLLIGARQ